MRLVLLGPPGVGKGTQARFVAEKLGIPAISTGEIFRSNIQSQSELGVLADRYISEGRLVPDEVTNQLVEARLAQSDAADGFLLDGYPRNVEQAVFLRDLLAKGSSGLDAVVDLTAPESVLVRHLAHRASVENRADDSPEVFAERLREYHAKTAPVSKFYADAGLLASVDGEGSIDEVTARVMQALNPAS